MLNHLVRHEEQSRENEHEMSTYVLSVHGISLVWLECTPQSPGAEQQPACAVNVQVQHRLPSGEGEGTYIYSIT